MKANEVLDRLVQVGRGSWQRYRLVWLVILAAAVIVVVRRLKKRGVRLPSLRRKDHASDHDAPKDGTI